MTETLYVNQGSIPQVMPRFAACRTPNSLVAHLVNKAPRKRLIWRYMTETNEMRVRIDTMRADRDWQSTYPYLTRIARFGMRAASAMWELLAELVLTLMLSRISELR